MFTCAFCIYDHCIYIYVYIYTCIHIHVCTCTHMYPYTHVYIYCDDIHMYTCIHVYICTHIHIHIHSYTYTYTPLYTGMARRHAACARVGQGCFTTATARRLSSCELTHEQRLSRSLLPLSRCSPEQFVTFCPSRGFLAQEKQRGGCHRRQEERDEKDLLRKDRGQQ